MLLGEFHAFVAYSLLKCGFDTPGSVRNNVVYTSGYTSMLRFDDKRGRSQTML